MLSDRILQEFYKIILKTFKIPGRILKAFYKIVIRIVLDPVRN